MEDHPEEMPISREAHEAIDKAIAARRGTPWHERMQARVEEDQHILELLSRDRPAQRGRKDAAPSNEPRP